MSDPAVARKTGQVKFFDSRKGFGFIKPDDGSRDVFISISRLPPDIAKRGLSPDERCSYVEGTGKKGIFARDFALA